MRNKQPRLRLEPKAYQELKRKVLERDGWKCQSCGQATELQVHHITRRSGLGDDSLENLISLCVVCHRQAHH